MKLRLLMMVLMGLGFPLFADSLKMEVEVYPLDTADFEVAERVVSGMISHEGKMVADKNRNRLVVFDYQENRDAIREALKKVRTPTSNVRIQVTFREMGLATAEGFGVDVNGSGKVAEEMLGAMGKQGGKGDVQIQNAHSSLASLVQQELLVVSGGKARLRIGTDLPYADWFWNYGLTHQLWSGEIKWKEVGARMVVEPYVMGDRVRLRVTPEFSYVLNTQTLSTVVESLTTEVVVKNGEEIELGGMPASNKEFYSRFLVGYTHLGEKKSLKIILKLNIEPMEVY